MSKIIQTRIDPTGDVHLDFSGFAAQIAKPKKAVFAVNWLCWD